MSHRLKSLVVLILVVNSAAVQAQTQPSRKVAPQGELQWYKGNLHTHSLWSDGDQFPEMISAWYREHGYNFLALSDHNVLSNGTRWMALEKIVARADDGILDRYRAKFGDGWVQTRKIEGSDALEVRLKPLDEFRSLVEQSGQFIMIQGEEISDSAQGKPVHMNVSNVQELILPVGGDTVREAMQNNLRLVLEQEEKTGRNLLLHLNHPNFHYAVTAEDLAHVVGEQFFEIYNGHPGVNQLGDDDHISIEHMWDVVNAMRLTVLSAEPMLGIGTDDSHEYHGRPGSRPGRGWVMVQARYLTPEHMVAALERGDFYASSGVSLKSIHFDKSSRKLSVEIEGAQGAEYKTQFITSLRNTSAPDQMPPPDSIGKVASEITGTSPSYVMQDNELYIRALITSSLDHTDPSIKDQKQQAWTQPVGWHKK